MNLILPFGSQQSIHRSLVSLLGLPLTPDLDQDEREDRISDAARHASNEVYQWKYDTSARDL